MDKSAYDRFNSNEDPEALEIIPLLEFIEDRLLDADIGQLRLIEVMLAGKFNCGHCSSSIDDCECGQYVHCELDDLPYEHAVDLAFCSGFELREEVAND